MVPVVNEKYQYILFYSAKAGCTSLRNLYIDIHRDEFTPEQLSGLNRYHNLNLIQPFQEGKDYSNYFTYVITRNPYSRAVSAFLDQFVYARNSGVVKMLGSCPPPNGDPLNFVEFLEYLKKVPDELRDSHFQTQAYFGFPGKPASKLHSGFRRLGYINPNRFKTSYSGDISDFNTHSEYVFKKVFREDSEKLGLALSKLADLKRQNWSLYGDEDCDDAALIPTTDLNELRFAPKPQDFYSNKRARELVYEIYKADFKLFGYSRDDIPHKKASPEIDSVPDDFDWQMYLRLNHDLPRDRINSERSVVRHYLEFGRFEKHLRAYKIEAPKGFDWRRYLSLHADLSAAGITTENAAIEHYISYGIREERQI